MIAKKSPLLLGLVISSLLWNLTLTTTVVLGDERFSNRVAGGGFHQYPLGLRLIYLVMTVFTLALLWFAIADRRNSQRFGSTIHLFISLVFFLSTLVNLISRSEPERINALPAFVIALYFLRRYKTLSSSR